MPFRAGRPNKDKQALRDMAASHGVDVLEMQIMMIKDLMKSYKNEVNKPRSRRSKLWFAVEEKLSNKLDEMQPYLQGKLSNVTMTDETPRPMVIIAPAEISDSKVWLEKCAPKRDDMVNDVVALGSA